jgi:succinate dehydrogenase flavin-adding protein (antitoxin of CptAB toxin-antitoxin module)
MLFSNLFKFTDYDLFKIANTKSPCQEHFNFQSKNKMQEQPNDDSFNAPQIFKKKFAGGKPPVQF